MSSVVVRSALIFTVIHRYDAWQLIINEHTHRSHILLAVISRGHFKSSHEINAEV